MIDIKKDLELMEADIHREWNGIYRGEVHEILQIIAIQNVADELAEIKKILIQAQSKKD